MTWDMILTVLCVALIAFGGWSLIRLLKERQAADRRYSNSDYSLPGTNG
jgi:hypothetical protein